MLLFLKNGRSVWKFLTATRSRMYKVDKGRRKCYNPKKQQVTRNFVVCNLLFDAVSFFNNFAHQMRVRWGKNM